MNTDCERFEDQLPEYASGTLPRAEARAVEEHLASCGSCAGALAVVRSVAAARVPVPEGLEARIRASVREAAGSGVPAAGDVDELARARAGRADPEKQSRRSSAGSGWRPWAVPLAAAAALAAVWVGLEIGPGAPESDDLALASETYLPGAWPAGDGEVAGDPLLSELSTDQLEQLLEEMGS